MIGHASIAEEFHRKRYEGTAFSPPVATHPDFNRDDAYRVQHEYVRTLLAEEEISGFKAGATAIVAQRALGLAEPLSGVIFARGQCQAGAPVALAGFRRLVLKPSCASPLTKLLTRRLPISIRSRAGWRPARR